VNGSGGSPVRTMSLEQIEEELSRVERTLTNLRQSLRRAHAESAAESSALKEMGNRAKSIADRPKSWRGAKRSDAQELEALRTQIKTRSEAVDRAVAQMKVTSEEARELDKRLQALSTRRSELLNQRG
jgi:chromosome segregation ATPase